MLLKHKVLYGIYYEGYYELCTQDRDLPLKRYLSTHFCHRDLNAQ